MDACECFALLPVVKILKCLRVLTAFQLKTVQHCLCLKKKTNKLTERFVAAVAEDLVVVNVSNFQQ